MSSLIKLSVQPPRYGVISETVNQILARFGLTKVLLSFAGYSVSRSVYTESAWYIYHCYATMIWTPYLSKRIWL